MPSLLDVQIAFGHGFQFFLDFRQMTRGRGMEALQSAHIVFNVIHGNILQQPCRNCKY